MAARSAMVVTRVSAVARVLDADAAPLEIACPRVPSSGHRGLAQ